MAARLLAAKYANTTIDTIICLNGCEVIGIPGTGAEPFLVSGMNALETIYSGLTGTGHQRSDDLPRQHEVDGAGKV